MSYSKPKDDRGAVRWHDEALANHQRAWDDMHQIGKTLGHDSPEYADARRMENVARRRDWSR